MSNSGALQNEMLQQHLLFQLLQTLDNGLITIDRNYTVLLWNGFMENHSHIAISHARGKNLFHLFRNLPEAWLKRKIDSVFRLQTRAFCTWEEHPRVFDFKSIRPLTGHSALMFQNITLIPLAGLDGQVAQVCLQIFDVTEIATRKIELEAANLSLKQLSRIDKLTGIYNRGYWEEQLEQEFNRCKRTSVSASLLMFDIDHFKQFNDHHGHVAGDNILRAVATQLKRLQRATDLPGRYGGEEFAIILPDTRADAALYVAERLRRKIAELRTEWHGESLRVTASIGVSEFDNTMPTHQSWIDHCDAALYEAKNKGRNCCRIAAPYARHHA